MKRLALLAVVGLIGLLPNMASAHSRFFVGFNVGVPFVGVGYGNYYGYRPAYYGGGCYAAPAAVYCAPAYAPPVVYAPPVYRYTVYYHYYHRPYYYGRSYYYYGR
jgi:hypothetical protein